MSGLKVQHAQEPVSLLALAAVPELHPCFPDDRLSMMACNQGHVTGLLSSLQIKRLQTRMDMSEDASHGIQKGRKGGNVETCLLDFDGRLFGHSVPRGQNHVTWLGDTVFGTKGEILLLRLQHLRLHQLR